MKRKKIIKKNGDRRSDVILAVFINVVILSFLLFILRDIVNSGAGDHNNVSAAVNDRIEVGPQDVEGIVYGTLSQATTEANIRLGYMYIGNIQQIDTNDDSYYGFLYRDYEMGNCVYWEIGDAETYIYFEAITGEILLYDHTAWYPGTISEQQAIYVADDIAEQFCQLPYDRQYPTAEFVESIRFIERHEYGENESAHHYWVVVYNREKENIPAEDNIRLKICPNGYLGFYYKVWNMDLPSLSTSYTVSAGEAEDIAMDYLEEQLEPNGTVEDSFKMIVRPNYGWKVPESPLDEDEDPTVAFGLAAECVWEVWIRTDTFHLYIFHIDGNMPELIGGDCIDGYYYDE